MDGHFSASCASAKRVRADSWTHSGTDSDCDSDASGHSRQLSLNDRNRRRRERRREKSAPNSRRLSRDIVRVLKKWMMSPEHYERPYPDEAEKAALCAETGITPRQLTTWFTNARKRIWAPRRKARGEFVPRIFTSQHMECNPEAQGADSGGSADSFRSAVVPVADEDYPAILAPAPAAEQSAVLSYTRTQPRNMGSLEVTSEANAFIDPTAATLDLFPLDDLFADAGLGFTHMCEQISNNLEDLDAIGPDFSDFELADSNEPSSPCGTSFMSALLDVVPLLKLPNASGIVPHSFASGFNGEATPLLLVNSQPTHSA